MLVMGCILSLTLVTDNAIAASKKKVVKKHVINSNEFNDEGSISTRQELQQIDVQQIYVDERYLGGKVFVKTIIFYDVTFGNNRHTIMWHEKNSNNYGFVTNN